MKSKKTFNEALKDFTDFMEEHSSIDFVLSSKYLDSKTQEPPEDVLSGVLLDMFRDLSEEQFVNSAKKLIKEQADQILGADDDGKYDHLSRYQREVLMEYHDNQVKKLQELLRGEE